MQDFISVCIPHTPFVPWKPEKNISLRVNQLRCGVKELFELYTPGV